MFIQVFVCLDVCVPIYMHLYITINTVLNTVVSLDYQHGGFFNKEIFNKFEIMKIIEIEVTMEAFF